MRFFIVVFLVFSGVVGSRATLDLEYFIPHTEETLRKYKHDVPSISFDELPKKFDAREKWPECLSLRTVLSQKQCGGCWAFATSSVLSDRLCVASNGSVNVILSADHLVSCCGHKCSRSPAGGCRGGRHKSGYEWMIKHGLVTGGTYESQYGCQPYVYGPCEGCGKSKWPTPKCVHHCTTDWNIPYEQDKHYGKKYIALSSDVTHIMKEIYVNGPVSANIITHEKFHYLEDGVYKVTKHDKPRGNHAIKIIGWGRQNDEDYWLIQNSWGNEWGVNGYGKIRRGTNEMEIESEVSAVVPKIDDENYYTESPYDTMNVIE